MACSADNLQSTSLALYETEDLMLTPLIPGPQSPGKDMDVFLRPLVDELNEL